MSAVLDNLYQTLNERADLVVGPEKVLYFLSTDFALFLGKRNVNLFVLSCYVMLCYIMLCYVILRYVMKNVTDLFMYLQSLIEVIFSPKKFKKN